MMVSNNQEAYELSLPKWFSNGKDRESRRIDYDALFNSATEYKKKHNIDSYKREKSGLVVLSIDQQDTFSHDGAELAVTDSIDDALCSSKFILKNLRIINYVLHSLDGHGRGEYIFHPYFWIDKDGRHPPIETIIKKGDLEERVWRVNPQVPEILGRDEKWMDNYVRHYVTQLDKEITYEINEHTHTRKKHPLFICPYHSPLGGIGHTLQPQVDSAITFAHAVKGFPSYPILKGESPYTQAFSIVKDEVALSHDNQKVGVDRRDEIMSIVKSNRAIVITGEIWNYCPTETIWDILEEAQKEPNAKELASKLYVLEDCVSPLPHEEQEAKDLFETFERFGVNVVRSTDPVASWPKIDPEIFREVG